MYYIRDFFDAHSPLRSNIGYTEPRASCIAEDSFSQTAENITPANTTYHFILKYTLNDISKIYMYST
jgi:hypothetical protein